MIKSERQETILRLVGAMRIARQSELVQTLRDNGFDVTQASVSRDLEELGIVKINGAYSQPERSNGLGLGLIGVESAGGHLIVAKTYPGLASALTVRIDAARIDDIVGTIAGDDTIFIAVNGEKEQRAVIKRLWELFDEK